MIQKYKRNYYRYCDIMLLLYCVSTCCPKRGQHNCNKFICIIVIFDEQHQERNAKLLIRWMSTSPNQSCYFTLPYDWYQKRYSKFWHWPWCMWRWHHCGIAVAVTMWFSFAYYVFVVHISDTCLVRLFRNTPNRLNLNGTVVCLLLFFSGSWPQCI